MATGTVDDDRRFAATFDFGGVDTGLVMTEENDTEVRCELLVIAHESEVMLSAAVTEAADMLDKAAGTVPAQPGVLLPDLGTRAGLTADGDLLMEHGLLIAPTLWGGQTPHVREDGRMTLILQLALLTDEEYSIGVDQGVDKLLRRLHRRGEDLADWRRD